MCGGSWAISLVHPAREALPERESTNHAHRVDSTTTSHALISVYPLVGIVRWKSPIRWRTSASLAITSRFTKCSAAARCWSFDP